MEVNICSSPSEVKIPQEPHIAEFNFMIRNENNDHRVREDGLILRFKDTPKWLNLYPLSNTVKKGDYYVVNAHVVSRNVVKFKAAYESIGETDFKDCTVQLRKHSNKKVLDETNICLRKINP